MSNSSIIDIAIGLAFIYLLLSLVVTSLTELIGRIAALRSSTLKSGIENLLKDSSQFFKVDGTVLSERFYNHPLIKRLSNERFIDKWTRRWSNPSYIPSDLFARALMDLIASTNKDGTQQLPANILSDFGSTLKDLDDNSEIKRLMMSLTQDVQWEIKTVRENIEKWYDESMDRVSGWYARKAQLIALILALAVSIGFNVDSFLIYQALKSNPALASATADFVVSQYNDFDPNKNQGKEITSPKDSPPTTSSSDVAAPRPPSIEEQVNKIKSIETTLYQLNLPIGWTCDRQDPRYFPNELGDRFNKFVGWFFTAIAVSLGAPFWFDALNKLVNIRAAGKKPKPEGEKKVKG